MFKFIAFAAIILIWLVALIMIGNSAEEKEIFKYKIFRLTIDVECTKEQTKEYAKKQIKELCGVVKAVTTIKNAIPHRLEGKVNESFEDLDVNDDKDKSVRED